MTPITQPNESSQPLRVTSTPEAIERRRQHRNEEALGNLFTTAGVVGGAALFTYVPALSSAAASVADLFPTTNLDSSMQSAFGRNMQDMFSDNTTRPSHIALELIRNVEELSPFKVMRTMGASHMMIPYVLGDRVTLDISPTMVLSQEGTFRATLQSRGEMDLLPEHIQHGFRLQDGNLYARNADGELGDVVLKNARPVMTHFQMPTDSSNPSNLSVFRNTVAGHLHTLHGGGTVDAFSSLIGSDLPPVMIIGGKSKAKVAHDLSISYFRSVVEAGGRMFDNGFEQIGDMAPGYRGSSLESALAKLPKMQLWTGGHYRQSVGSSLIGALRNNAGLAVNLAGLLAVNEFAVNNATEGSALSKGLIPAAANIVAGASVEFSELWSDNFQGYKEAQEYYAPGSTSLLTLAGAPLAVGVTGALASFGHRMYDSALHGIAEAEIRASKVARVFPQALDSVLPTRMRGLELNRTSRYGWRGVALAAITQIPFVPGALIGESSESKIAQYSGEEDVAVRGNRWWMTGCLAPDHLVLTRSKITTAEEIQVGDMLPNRHGEYCRVNRVLIRDTFEQLYDIRVHGSLSISSEFTGNHPILVRRPNKEVFVRADCIEVGDFLVSPLVDNDVSVVAYSTIADYIDLPAAVRDDGRIWRPCYCLEQALAIRMATSAYGVYPDIVCEDMEYYLVSSDEELFQSLTMESHIIGAMHDMKTQVIMTQNRILLRVAEVSSLEYEGKVYDYEVDDSHEFHNGLFIVHNSGAYEGGGIKYYDKSWYTKVMAETTTKSMFGDAKTRAAMNPLLHPLDYIANPYQLEKMHAEDRPYPVWGMDVSAGSFMGKLFEKTIGAFIKPDIISPRLLEELPSSESGEVMVGKTGIEKPRPDEHGVYAVSAPVTKAEASLIEEGKLLAPSAATYEPGAEAVSWSWGAFKDFVGLKGWMLGLAEESFSLPTEQLSPQLARSGEMTNVARTLADANLGGMFGLCFVGDTKVKTLVGYVPIRDIEVGARVLSLDGHYRQVIDKICHVVHDKAMIEVEVDSVSSRFIGTESHWVPILRQERVEQAPYDVRIEDVQIKDIEVGDYAVYPVCTDIVDLHNIDLLDENGPPPVYLERMGVTHPPGAHTVAKAMDTVWMDRLESLGTHDYQAEACSRYLSLSGESLWLLGLYAVSGASKAGSDACILATGKDKSVTVIKAKETLLNDMGIISQISHLEGKDSVLICWKHDRFGQWLLRHFGKRPQDRFIPYWVKQLPDHKLMMFMSGIQQGIGDSVDLRHNSSQLIIDVLDILLRFKIRSTIQLPQSMSETGSLQVIPEDLMYYHQLTSGTLPSPPSHIGGDRFLLDGMYFTRVLRVDPVNVVEPVYDLTMEGMHYYTIQQTAVHNTESQRRYIPTPAGISGNRINPLKNTMPSWLPGSQDSFWLDLQTGDPFSKVENGEGRLPGLGYETLHKELAGYKPEDYPDIYKLKILSDVALGSTEYYDVRNRINKREKDGALTSHESGMLKTIRTQERGRSNKKQFDEYKTDAELEGASAGQRAASKVWQAMSHGIEKSLPTESLTFFRPAGKLIHKRTAIEDYERTQLEGSDSAIWDTPFTSFIRPTSVAIRRKVQEDFLSDQVKSNRHIEEFFDSMEYVKQRNLYKDAVKEGRKTDAVEAKSAYQKTLRGALSSGLDTDVELLRSYIALPSAEKDYFASFINAKKEDREKIAGMTPSRISALYQNIWSRKDILDEAQQQGASKEEATQRVRDRVRAEDAELKRSNKQEYEAWRDSKDKETTTLREHLADKSAEKEIQQTTGMPSKNFSGWDPRIDMDRIKLRALQIGKENFFEFGFWKTDAAELERYVSVIDDQEVTDMSIRLAEEVKRKLEREDQIRESLQSEGIVVGQIALTPGRGDIDINMRTDNE